MDHLTTKAHMLHPLKVVTGLETNLLPIMALPTTPPMDRATRTPMVPLTTTTMVHLGRAIRMGRRPTQETRARVAVAAGRATSLRRASSRLRKGQASIW